MMKLLLFALAHLASFALAEEQQIRYDNYSVYRVIPQDNVALAMLKEMESSAQFSSNFWTPVARKSLPVSVMVPPQYKNDFVNVMKEYNVDMEMMMENVQEQIDSQKQRTSQPSLGDDKLGKIDWANYHTLSEIYGWLDQLVKDYPKVVTLFDAGRTYENRVIKGIKISFDKKNENRSIFIESNIHAREWISGAVSTFIINEVLTSRDESFRKLAESYDWYLTPITNPDGFEYSHTKDRMWRKTRRPINLLCVGVDPNRNFDYRWNTVAANNNPCTEAYAGPKAASEIEIQTLSKTLSNIAPRLRVYISFHSYSQLLMVPYGHTREHLDNYNETYPVGLKAAKALSQRYGTKYQVGDIASTVYYATGSSVDWIKGVHHVPYTYAYELRDTGRYGFLLPKDQIIPTALETLDSFKVILQAAKDAEKK